MTATIRKLDQGDEPRWRELFDAYTVFYERQPDEAITRHLWTRLMDFASPVNCVVAEVKGQGVVGIAHYILHDNTSTLLPVCYLQDLFVDPAIRATGVGATMIDWLIAEAKAQGWSRVYWNTKENNYRARGLYDKYTPHSGFLRYVVQVQK